MTFEDPFFTVREEVLKALTKTVSLYRRWNDLQAEPITASLLKEEIEWTTTELRNSLRSIEWDLEDLDDTISIVEKNFNKFKIDSNELVHRKKFVDDTRAEVKCMREKLSYYRPADTDKILRQNSENIVKMVGGNNTFSNARYSKLENQLDSPEKTSQFAQTYSVHKDMMNTQDDQLELISDSIGTLKNISRQIGIEIDEQDEMLNELQHEMGQTDSRLDNTMRKIARVMNLTNDRSQWIAIILLSSLLLIILVLFVVL